MVWADTNKVLKSSTQSDDVFSRFKVCLLLTSNPGHYDLLYTPEQYRQLKSPQPLEMQSQNSLLHRGSMFRPENYRHILDDFLRDPIANQEKFKTIIEYLKTDDFQEALDDIREKMQPLINSNDKPIRLLATSLMAIVDNQVLQLHMPRQYDEFKRFLSEYVEGLRGNPEQSRWQLLESILLFPIEVQKSLDVKVYLKLEPLKKDSKELMEIISSEFDILRGFVPEKLPVKIHK